MPTLEELNAMLADPGFQERHKEFERQMYERLEPLGDAIQKMMKPTPPSRQDPDLMTEEELSAAFEAMPLPARQEAMKRALDEEIGPVAMMSPTSGLTSIPLGAPWPPLSREQVVKLHEALVAFRGEMEASKGIRSHEDQQDMIWGAAVELDGLLVEMGIGSPPPTRTWTHEEVAKVAEEVQQDRFGHITDLSRHSKPREEPTTDEDSGPGAMSWQQAEEFGSPFAAAVEPAWLRLDWGSVQMPVKNVSGRDLAEGQMVTTAQVQVEPPKRNCWTCRLGSEQFCSLTQGANVGTAKREDVVNWRLSHLQVTQQTDGCPGWEPKP